MEARQIKIKPKNNTTLYIRNVNPATIEKLKQLAKKYKLKVSEVLRQIVEGAE